MYNGNSIFVRFGRYGNRFQRVASSTGGWLLIAPGLSLVLLGLAILIWPELLAYMVAGLLLAAGTTLALWGWRLGKAQKQMQRRRQNGMFYREDIHHGGNW